MPFDIPALSDTREFLVAAGKALFPDRNYGNPRSYHARRAGFAAAAVTQLHAHVDSVQKDVMPDTAGDVAIDRWGTIIGTVRKGATPARKAAAGRVRGAAATAVPLDEELTHSSGLRFKVASATVVSGAGFVDVDIAAIDTGQATRLTKGEVLEFQATPAGLETQVVLQKDLDEDGFDREQFGSYRKRVLDAFSEPTSGGSQSDYVRWALEVDGISAAFCYPNRAGLGTVDVVGLHTGTGAARILSGGEVAELLAYLKTKAPAHLAATPGALRVLTVIADPQPVELVITPDGLAAHAFDWTGGPVTVLAYTAGTREVQTAAPLPAAMKAGHRISFKGVVTAQDGTEFQIEALTAADKFILGTAPAVNLAATDIGYSGGPLVTPIRKALLGHINGEDVYAGKNGVPMAASQLASTVGLEVLAEGLGPANPAGAFGTWSGGLIRAVLGKIASYRRGVRNYNIALPAADYEATNDAFPNDGQIHLITPSSVLVRGA